MRSHREYKLLLAQRMVEYGAYNRESLEGVQAFHSSVVECWTCKNRSRAEVCGKMECKAKHWYSTEIANTIAEFLIM